MQQPSSVYRSCIEEAAAQGRPMLQRAIAEVERSHEQRVQRAPDAQQREFVHDAIGLLHRHGATLAQRFADVLLARFAVPLANPATRAGGGSLKFAELELVDDDKVQESVEVVRAEQIVAGMVEAELVQLNALICAAQGLPTVQADRNPMRPETYVRCLREVVNEVTVPHAVRMRWMQFLGESLGPELVASYRLLIARLRDAGLNEAEFQIVPGTSSPVGQRSAPTAPRVATAATNEAPTLLTVRALQRLLAGELDAPVTGGAGRAGGPETEFPGTMPAAMEVLQDIRQFDAVLQRLRERERQSGGTGSAAYREAVRREAHRPGQAIALEVVSLMVENVAGDPRLLPPVAQAVRVLEPALLRLALADPRFFSNRRHPARRLLDEMTSRSLAWTSVDEAGFEVFLAPLTEAVDALVATNVAGPEPFAFALQVLDEAWSRGHSREKRRRDKAVRALMRAEQRNLLATRVAREISGRADVAAAPGEVAAFLRGPWAQVIAQAQLDEDPEKTADTYRSAVPELLWSVQPHTSPASVARLGRQLPGLLETLQAGMRSVGYAESQVRRYFDRLQALQQAAMKGVAPESMPADAASERLDSLIGPVLDEGAWLAPAEAQQTGFLESVDGVGQPLFDATQVAVDGGLAALSGPLPLQAGSWVDMQLEGTWSRWQLTWTSPHSMLWMFTDATGRTHTMRPALAAAMGAAGTLRVVSGEHLLDDALDAVADAAVHNSAEIRL